MESSKISIPSVLYLAATLAWMVSAPAEAQMAPKGDGLFFTPSFSVAGIYDDNIFYRSAEDKQNALYARLGPQFELLYRTRPFEANAAYGFDSEIFPDHLSYLNEFFARQNASAGIRYSFDTRTTLALGAGYRLTHRPHELVPDTGLDYGRRRSESFSANATFMHQLTRKDSWNVGYGFYRLDFGELETTDLRRDTDSHSLSTGWSHVFSTKTVGQASYTFRVYIDQRLAVLDLADNSKSHVFTYSVTRYLAPRTLLTLMGGPRFSETPELIDDPEDPELVMDQTIDPEALVSLHHRWEKTSFMLAYTRSQNHYYGLSGFVNTESLTLNVGHELRHNLRFSISPGVYRNTRSDTEILSYRAGAEATLELSRWIFVSSSYRFNYQNGRFFWSPEGTHVDPNDYTHNVATIRLVIGKPYRLK